MHPLPRLDEITTEVDRPEGGVLQQARNGLCVRMGAAQGSAQGLIERGDAGGFRGGRVYQQSRSNVIFI